MKKLCGSYEYTIIFIEKILENIIPNEAEIFVKAKIAFVFFDIRIFPTNNKALIKSYNFFRSDNSPV
jgi:hypothetical protein